MALQDDINNFCHTTNTAIDFLTLAAQTANTTTNRIVTVANTSSLPDLSLSTVEPGTVVFVESLGIPVVAQLGCWTGLDNRELRNDTNLNLAYGWGCSNYGQIGDNSPSTRNSPVAVSGAFIDWRQISTSGYHTVGVRTNGTAWTWGFNNCGQLGDTTLVSKSSPVSVVGGFTDWCQVSAGGNFTVAVRTNGTAWAWGSNTCGQLGDFTTVSKTSPVSVVGGFTDWCQVAAGSYHSIGVRTGGSLWAWGGNNRFGALGLGVLGDGTTVNKSSPISVIGGFTDWCRVTASRYVSIAIRSNGTIWAWGCGAGGRLGDNAAFGRSSPVSVAGGFTDWCRIATISPTSNHMLAQRTDGSLWAWGCNAVGQLGDNSIVAKSSPVSVVGGFTDWCDISAGGAAHSAAVRTNGTLWTWGGCGSFTLAQGTNYSICTSSPISIIGGFTDWSKVSAGRTTNLAIRSF